MKKITILLTGILLLICLTACGGPKQVSEKPLSVSISGQLRSGYFTGTMEADLPNGYGVFTFNDGNTIISYSGIWAGGLVASDGSLDYDGLCVSYNGMDYIGHYTGDASNGWPKGDGHFISSDGVSLEYTGNWLNASFSEAGTLTCEGMELTFQGITYTGRFSGEVQNGIPQGTGTFTMPEENNYLIYEGGWDNGQFNGDGTIKCSNYKVVYPDSITRFGLYEGTTLDGQASGSGIFSTVDELGDAYSYDGAWANGLPNGYGIRKWDSHHLQGQFTDGLFTPTVPEFFITEGERTECEYTINSTALAFLSDNSDLFENNDLSSYTGSIDHNFRYDDFSKNHTHYGDTLYVIPDLEIFQISEDTYHGADHTFCLLMDEDSRIYYVNLYGFCDNIYEDDIVTLTGLPLDYFTYKNVQDTHSWAIAFAGVSIE